MDLEEYLEKSRAKRSSIKKFADAFFNKTLSSNLDSVQSHKIPDTFPGPSPTRLKLFESEVNQQLRKFFSPGLYQESPNKAKFIVQDTLNDRIRKTYSRNSPIIRKKQLVIIPKEYFSTPIKIPSIGKHNKFYSASPIVNDTIKEFSQAKTLRARKTNKEDILLPILSTIGSHEQRNKIYKYK